MGVNDMDIVEFVEKVCEFSLTDFQKEFVRKVYDAAKNEEHVFLLIFDFKMHFKSFIEMGIGTNRTCVIDRRGIAQKVLILNAGAFVVVHNHPSGDPTPSKLDIDAAKTIDEIGQLIDIPMKDFMMIGSETYYSVKENGDI